MGFTNYTEHLVLDQLFGGTGYATMTGLTGLYVALSTTTPAEDGTNFTEPSTSSGYARVLVPNTKSYWTTASQTSPTGFVTNKQTITFPTASGGWGTVTYGGIYSATGGGNLITILDLNLSKTVVLNESISFPSGSLIIGLN